MADDELHPSDRDPDWVDKLELKPEKTPLQLRPAEPLPHWVLDEMVRVTTVYNTAIIDGRPSDEQVVFLVTRQFPHFPPAEYSNGFAPEELAFTIMWLEGEYYHNGLPVENASDEGIINQLLGAITMAPDGYMPGQSVTTEVVRLWRSVTGSNRWLRLGYLLPSARGTRRSRSTLLASRTRSARWSCSGTLRRVSSAE